MRAIEYSRSRRLRAREIKVVIDRRLTVLEIKALEKDGLIWRYTVPYMVQNPFYRIF